MMKRACNSKQKKKDATFIEFKGHKFNFRKRLRAK